MLLYAKSLAKSTDYNPDGYIRHLKKIFSLKSSKALKRIYFKTPSLYRLALYPETRAALTILKTAYRLGIYTEGFRKFQKAKLKLSGLLPFFEPDLTFIHRRKLTPWAVKQLPGGAAIVDDNLEVINALSKFPRVTPVWLNRKDKKKPLLIRTIHSLKELSSALI